VAWWGWAAQLVCFMKHIHTSEGGCIPGMEPLFRGAFCNPMCHALFMLTLPLHGRLLGNVLLNPDAVRAATWRP